ncbi:MAG: superoxide dismutase family protein [Fibrobacterota bacterium]|nr:superoxide dismutase family protein [Fibrobacterota bacterium]
MELKNLSKALVYPFLGLLAVSCASNKQSRAPRADAKAEIAGYAPNTQAGTIWFMNDATKGTRIQGEIIGLLPNRTYAMHVHEYGNCSAPEAAGEHFDPVGSNTHGTPGASPGQKHAGDLPNIRTDDNGRAKVDVTSQMLGIGASDFSVIGKSIVIHASQDDYQTQPAGGAGEKIACGVIQPVRGDG